MHRCSLIGFSTPSLWATLVGQGPLSQAAHRQLAEALQSDRNHEVLLAASQSSRVQATPERTCYSPIGSTYISSCPVCTYHSQYLLSSHASSQSCWLFSDQVGKSLFIDPKGKGLRGLTQWNRPVC